MTEEAHLEETPSGLRPTSDGWFVVNVRDTAWVVHEAFGSGCVFESRQAGEFPELGINISVVQPGQPLCLYHEESAQEDFLVLAGECVLLVNGEERPLRTWDFVHSPAGTEHVIVGAGGAPAIVLARRCAPRDRAAALPQVRPCGEVRRERRRGHAEPRGGVRALQPPGAGATGLLGDTSLGLGGV